MAPRLRGVCFDLWNTLASTVHEPHPIRALASAFGLEGRPGWRRTLEETIMTRRLPGITAALDELERATGRPPGNGWTRRDLVLAWGAASNANRLYPDALPALRRLARDGLRLGLVSNTQSFDLDLLDRDGIAALMQAVCLSCDCGMLKPDPGIFSLAAGRLGIPASEILMVGDRPDDDVAGARRAGLRAVLLDRPAGAAPPRRREGEPVLRGLDELPGFIASLS
ncbi:MAG TPA: HAD family hydrolase [Candidatus Polarisedimenticolia bacterium]|nr:HAD family hydrolase [Candidatus Polarisedimenticolia bacterium]